MARPSQSSESKLLQILKKYESGSWMQKLSKICSLSLHKLSHWKKRYSGIWSKSVLFQLHEFEKQNTDFEKICDELNLHHKALKKIVEKNRN